MRRGYEMKKCICGLIVSLGLLAGAGSGLRAENGRGAFAKPDEAARPRSKGPEQLTFTVKLPEIGPELDKIVHQYELEVTLTDAAGGRSGQMPIPGQLASRGRYDKGWKDRAGKPVTQFLFAVGAGDARDLKIRIDQAVFVRMGGPAGLVQALKARHTIPLAAAPGETAVPFLFDLVSIDAGAVAWGSGRGGVRGVKWMLTDAADPARKISGMLSSKDGTAAATLVHKEGALTPEIEFICNGNGRRVKWPGSGADLRKSGLKLVLTGDQGCPR